MTLIDAFEYRQGILYWKTCRPGRVRVGDVAGCKDRKGYLVVCLNGKTHMVHRVIWEMHNGPIPDGHQIDHIDHDRTNNLLSNLRAVCVTTNNRNSSKRADNQSGATGVYWDSINNRWVASIRVNKRVVYLGRFQEFEDAAKARKLAESKYGFHENHGK